jgi:hypothetical protein
VILGLGAVHEGLPSVEMPYLARSGPEIAGYLIDPVSQADAGGQAVRVLLAEDPLGDGDQRSELVAGPDRITRLPGPAGQGAASTQGVRVLPA